jgi:hypothetical protein
MVNIIDAENISQEVSDRSLKSSKYTAFEI